MDLKAAAQLETKAAKYDDWSLLPVEFSRVKVFSSWRSMP